MAIVYLDHAATTPVRREAFDAMVPWLTSAYGNPSGGHAIARRAREAIDDARDVVASTLGCTPGEVVFTSGGTEADNLAITGLTAGAPRSAAVCSAVEHHAVLHAVESAGGCVVPVDDAGRVDHAALKEAVTPHTRVVSVMLANNEVGTINDLSTVAAVLPAGVALHTDAVQAVAWTDVATLAAPAALVSIAGHKIGGPQGVGALVVRGGLHVEPMFRGGGQERERRSGTHNVAGIVGLAAALAADADDRVAAASRIATQRDRLIAGISAGVDGVVDTTAGADRLPNIAHLRIHGVEAESLLFLLDEAGVCASAGSSCASGAMEPSHVLAAMGVDRASARTAIRLSLGRSTTDADIEAGITAVVAAVRRLRR